MMCMCVVCVCVHDICAVCTVCTENVIHVCGLHVCVDVITGRRKDYCSLYPETNSV